jgi:Na+/glutamate symporter
MWPFRKRQDKKNHMAKRVIAGLIIGGAIGSIVGKKLMDDQEKKKDDEAEEQQDGE